jgi:hypothetical protein
MMAATLCGSRLSPLRSIFDHVKEDGVYLCEDLHTSYWLRFGGGYKRRGTFIEYSKNFIDYLHAWHSEQRSLKVNDFTRSVSSVHYYDSIVVIEKSPQSKPFDERTGKHSFEDLTPERSGMNRLARKGGAAGLRLINKALRFFRLGGFIWK